MNQYIVKNMNVDTNDIYHQHQQVAACFSATEHVRYRVEGNKVIVNSDQPPMGSITCQMRSIPMRNVGTQGTFKVRVNIEKKMYIKGGDGPVVPIKDYKEIVDKFHFMSKAAGFSIKELQEVSMPYTLFGVKTMDKNKITLNVVDFEGRLEVTEKDAFVRTIENGIGRGKGFGVGLLIFKEE